MNERLTTVLNNLLTAYAAQFGKELQCQALTAWLLRELDERQQSFIANRLGHLTPLEQAEILKNLTSAVPSPPKAPGTCLDAPARQVTPPPPEKVEPKVEKKVSTVGKKGNPAKRAL